MKAEDMVNRNMDEKSFQGSSKSLGKGFTNGMGGRKVQGQSQRLVNGNGLVNGTGMTNGLATENGFINGTGVTNGFVNGTGVTNGLTNGMTNGMTNGLAPDFGNEMRINENAISPKKTSLVLIIVVLLIIPSIFLMYSYDDPSFEGGLRVDGDFSEWNDISLYSDPGTASTPALDISNYAVTTNERNDMFIYAQSQGSWLASANADSLCVFIDNDNDASTGYIIEGMGAEYMIDIYGWENSIRGKQFSEFNGNDQHNWSAWGSGGSMSAALSGGQIEMSISSTHLSLGNNYKLLLLTKRGGEIDEICHAQVAEGKGALVVEQTPLDVSGVISANTVLELELNAYGQAVTVNSISLSYAGVGSATVSGLPVTVSVGSPVVLNVEAPITALGQGTYVDVAVSSVTSDGTSNIIGNGLKAYAHAPPAGISIDGAFADWGSVTRSTDAASDVDNPNVDISNYASVNSTTQAYFYLKVNDNGEMFAGGMVPQLREKPEAAGEPGEPGQPQPPKPLPRRTGEDITRIYVDTVAGGQNVGGIRADYLIEIKGINGEITSRRLYSLPGKHFTKEIAAANGVRELETGLLLTDIGYAGNMSVYFETTDWQRNKDASEILVGGVRDGVRSSAIGPNLDSEPGGSTLAQPFWPAWNHFANDIADTKSDGSSVTVAEPSANITDLYSGNDTDFLYIRIKTMNTTQDSLTNRTFCVYVDVDGGGWNDWLIKENSTGLEYYYWDDFNNWWEWNNTETLIDSDKNGAVRNLTVNNYWHIDFAINKTIVKNGTTVVGSYTRVGAASNATEDLTLNHITANATISYLRDAWYYEDIISLTQIPEFSAMVVPLLVMIAIPIFIRKRRSGVTAE